MTGRQTAHLVLFNAAFPSATFVDANGWKVFNLPSDRVVRKSLSKQEKTKGFAVKRPPAVPKAAPSLHLKEFILGSCFFVVVRKQKKKELNLFSFFFLLRAFFLFLPSARRGTRSIFYGASTHK